MTAPKNHGTALVTGTSSGLGAIYADRLARRWAEQTYKRLIDWHELELFVHELRAAFHQPLFRERRA
jgi:NAD(P)-dependent dehydrogenase (short-subunit alcohol dehydrogenase family)